MPAQIDACCYLPRVTNVVPVPVGLILVNVSLVEPLLPGIRQRSQSVKNVFSFSRRGPRHPARYLHDISTFSHADTARGGRVGARGGVLSLLSR